jgi:import inner membrane translocase subunit TIM17
MSKNISELIRYDLRHSVEVFGMASKASEIVLTKKGSSAPSLRKLPFQCSLSLLLTQISSIKARAPVLGYVSPRILILTISSNLCLCSGNFGVWGGLFSVWDCSIKGIRQKEDPWNAIGAGFMTGGSLAIRGGFKSARNSAIGCAILLAVIEGVGIGFQRMMAEGTRLELPKMTAES